MGKVYKTIAVEEAESLFDSGVEGVQFQTNVDTWRRWCQTGTVGDRNKFFSPLEMVVEYPEVEYRVEVE